MQLEAEKNREPERQKAGDEVKRLQMIKEDVYSFANMETEVKRLEAKLSVSNEDQKIADESIKKTDEYLKMLQDEKQEIEQGQLTFLENKRKIELLDAELEMLSKYEGLLSRFEKSKESLDHRKQVYENSQHRLLDGKALVEELEQKWLHSQAVILAGKLHNGEACPVCGSPDHPSPATLIHGSVPTEVDIRAAKIQASELEAEKAKAESSFYEGQSVHNTMSDSLNDLFKDILTKRPDFSNESLERITGIIGDERRKLLLIQTQLVEKIKKLESITKSIQTNETNKQSLNEKRHKLAETIHELTIQYTEKKTTLNRMVGQIPEELRTVTAYEKQVQHALENQKALEYRWEKINQQYQETRENFATEKARLETIEKQVVETSNKLALEKESFIQKLAEQGFTSYKHYEGAKRSEQQLQNLNESIRTYREDLRSIIDRYNDLAQQLTDVKEPDLDHMRQTLEEMDNVLSSLQDEVNRLFMKKRTNEEILDKVERINEELKGLEERYKLIGHLYEIAKGQNTYRITFERFVLAAFLDDILAQANVRLTKMTSGRYQLLRKTDRSKGSAQSGLELLVFDQYTGQERHVKTLSGGESFKAALSLALGLAEVVQQHAGGVSLETMFIDEGFGTLDPESLDQAIEALIDIQSSGRLVGIISHVPELKERIDARLEVYAAQTGSRTEFQFMN